MREREMAGRIEMLIHPRWPNLTNAEVLTNYSNGKKKNSKAKKRPPIKRNNVPSGGCAQGKNLPLIQLSLLQNLFEQ